MKHVTEAQLREDFPEWSIIRTSDTGRWWAIRYPDLGPRTRWSAPHRRTEVDTDTAEELREQLKRLEAEAHDGW